MPATDSDAGTALSSDRRCGDRHDPVRTTIFLAAWGIGLFGAILVYGNAAMADGWFAAAVIFALCGLTMAVALRQRFAMLGLRWIAATLIVDAVAEASDRTVSRAVFGPALVDYRSATTLVGLGLAALAGAVALAGMWGRPWAEFLGTMRSRSRSKHPIAPRPTVDATSTDKTTRRRERTGP